ncbi:MAG: serine/threonine-protein kinase, partial [Acidobacteriota bacterium]
KLVHPRHLRSRSRRETQQRLEREAQALARMSHPNVLAVHDVGDVGGQLYVATELVDGFDLKAWLQESDRTRSEILEVFHQAGSGLAAAHDAGLLHRDFKLENVMIGQDGRVRVLDFGLARSHRQADDEGSTVLGTPAYAAPEQLAGDQVTAAADQFSFCVALYRALCAAPPFAPSASQQPLVASAWALDPIVLDNLPQRLRQVLQRGLSFTPEERYPSMQALLADLDGGRGQRRRRLLMAALLATALGAGLAVWGTSVLRQRQLCGNGEARFAAVWSAPRRQAIATAFAASGLPYAEASRRGAESIIDNFGRQWAAMHRQACWATAVEGTQSPELLDRRMACLDRRLQEVDALAEVLMRDETTVEHAVRAAGALPTIAQCADSHALLATAPPPDDPEQSREIDRLRRRLATVEALLLTGDYAAGYQRATELVVTAEALSYWPLTAEALLLRGRFEIFLDRPRAADASLGSALEAAQAGGHDRVAAEAFVRQVRVAGYQQADFPRGERYARQAEATLARLNRPDDLSAVLAGNRGALLAEQGHFAGALAEHRRALAIRLQKQGPQHPQTSVTLTRIGDVLRRQDDLALAADHYRQALEINRQQVGEEHPYTARLLSKVGKILLAQGDAAGAREHFERALTGSRQTLEPDHPYIVTPLTYLAQALVAQGAYEEAIERYHEALAILEGNANPDPRRLAVVLSGVGRAASAAGDPDQAEASYRRALAQRQQVYGDTHPAVAETAFNLGEIAKSQGRFDAALELYQRALAIWQATQPDNAFRLAIGQTGVGQALLESGRPHEALPILEQALALQPAGHDPEFLATTQFALARALDAVGGDPQRARDLAYAARDSHAEGRAEARAELDRVEAWLRDRGAPPP